MTVPRGPTRRPTAGDPWAGARKSHIRLVCGRGRPCRAGGAAGPAGCVAQGECSGGHSRGERAGVQREPGPGRDRASAPPRASGRGRRPSPAVGLWRQGRCLRPTAWGQARPPCPRSLTLSGLRVPRGCPPQHPSGPSWHSLVLVSVGRSLGGSWGDRGGGAGSVHQVPNTIWGQPPLSPPPLCDQREQGSCRPQSSGRMGGSSLGCPVLESQQPRPVSRGVCLDQRGHLPWPVTC